MPSSPRSTRPAQAIALAVVGLCLAGCGPPAKTPADRLDAAPAATLAGRTAEVTETTTTQPATGPVTTVDSQGLVNFATRRARMSFVVQGHPATVISDGPSIYEKLPALATAHGGKPWLKIDLTVIGRLAGIGNLGGTGSGGSSSGVFTDPTQGLAFLRGISGPITSLGAQQIRGLTTTHFRATVDLAKAAAQSPPDQQATLRQVIGGLGVRTTVIDVWLDAQDHVRRFHETLTYHPPASSPFAAAAPKSVDATADYYDFGLPATILPPPAEQTTDLTQLLAPLTQTPKPLGPTPATDKLAGLLIPTPAGYTQQPDAAGDTGPADLAKAVRDDGQPRAKQVLVTDGFLAGYQRAWTSPVGGEIAVTLYEFATPAGAVHYLRRATLVALAPSSGEHVRRFSVPQIPGAVGVGGDASGTKAADVLSTRGRYLVQAITLGAAFTTTQTIDLAEQQRRML